MLITLVGLACALLIVVIVYGLIHLRQAQQAKAALLGGAGPMASLQAGLEAELRAAREQSAAAGQTAAEARSDRAEAERLANAATAALETVREELAVSRSAEVQVRSELAIVRSEAQALAAGKAEEAHRLTEELARLSARANRVTEAEQRLSVREERLGEREVRQSAREDRLATDTQRLERDQQTVTGDRAELDQRRAELADLRAGHIAELERIAGLTQADAAAELTQTIEGVAKRQAAITVRDLEAEARREADARAREIVSQAIQRVASAQTSESVVAVLHLPGDDMKGRIIGREGRNIRTFETLTGVNVLIDDTPEAVTLSCFDPVRREVARVTLDALIADGRIHPQRIEDAYEQAKAEVEATIDTAGHDALLNVGLADAHPELVTLLGRLRYRTSYGQNVLRHLMETAHIASGMAAELGLGRAGVQIVKRAAFFHDIGKALTHEVEGSHALIGAEVARRCGESEDVVHAIAAHHLEVAPQTVEAWLTIGSDSCSGSRPGARRESLEAYVDRLKRIEEIAHSREGVERVFAMSAGRELRVMVLPDEVDDLGAQVLARDIAKQIEDELTYPGQIRVTVVRESRATETAH